MDASRAGRRITVRILRPGETSSPEDDWAGTTAAERIEAVWMLTLQCLAWQGLGDDEPRLQRSVVRIQRPGR